MAPLANDAVFIICCRVIIEAWGPIRSAFPVIRIKLYIAVILKCQERDSMGKETN